MNKVKFRGKKMTLKVKYIENSILKSEFIITYWVLGFFIYLKLQNCNYFVN